MGAITTSKLFEENTDKIAIELKLINHRINHGCGLSESIVAFPVATNKDFPHIVDL